MNLREARGGRLAFISNVLPHLSKCGCIKKGMNMRLDELLVQRERDRKFRAPNSDERERSKKRRLVGRSFERKRSIVESVRKCASQGVKWRATRCSHTRSACRILGRSAHTVYCSETIFRIKIEEKGSKRTIFCRKSVIRRKRSFKNLQKFFDCGGARYRLVTSRLAPSAKTLVSLASFDTFSTRTNSLTVFLTPHQRKFQISPKNCHHSVPREI
ncbi:hypothetical protein B9Z55_001223 [Caenorhabditis nigoni]|uniref:Uncharacterized protein n=1 Tax=Caenorhabditis nigoni TaxID=1611254 RepID=A0A2G5VEP2_9PELO|nr:hypothetical protein B9Z55_001223 [Caenorhabditis nigoni]